MVEYKIQFICSNLFRFSSYSVKRISQRNIFIHIAFTSNPPCRESEAPDFHINRLFIYIVRNPEDNSTIFSGCIQRIKLEAGVRIICSQRGFSLIFHFPIFWINKLQCSTKIFSITEIFFGGSR